MTQPTSTLTQSQQERRERMLGATAELAPLQQGVGQARAQEAGTAGDEDLHVLTFMVAW